MSILSESNSLERHKSRKILNKKNYWIALIMLLLALFIGGYVYESTMSALYVKPLKASSLTINGVKYNYSVELKGDYTVIVDGTAGSSIINHQALLGKFDGNARLFFYDRPGYGNTEGETKTPKELAEDLHFMFRKFGWKMKFILVGEEYGSLVMQEYLNLYPEEVIGAIMINPIGESLGGLELSKYVDRRTAPFFSRKILGTFGITRFLDNSGMVDFFDDVDMESQENKAFYSNLWLSKEHLDAVDTELQLTKTLNPVEVKEGLLGDNPFYLITSKKNLNNFPQENYLKYSSNTETVIVSDSVEDVILEKPEDLAAALSGMIKKIQRLEKLKN